VRVRRRTYSRPGEEGELVELCTVCNRRKDLKLRTQLYSFTS